MKYDPYSKGLKCRVFDIETTGLYPVRDRIVSASFADPDGSGLVQYFTESPEAEDFTVSCILRELEDCDAVITYNGNTFDLPFLLARSRKFGIADRLPLIRHVDIYRWLKSYWPLAESMESMRQKAVEEVLGLAGDRTDMINGGECIELYTEYLRLGREEAKELILLHNADDVRQLAAITNKLSFLPYARIAFEQGLYLRFPAEASLIPREYRVMTGPFKLDIKNITVNGRIDPPCVPTSYFRDGFDLQAGADGKFTLRITLMNSSDIYFADLQDLPVDPYTYKGYAGSEQGYLVLSDPDGIKYDACLKLAGDLITTLA